MLESNLPPRLRALTAPPLKTVSIRLEADTLERINRLREERLHGPTMGALMRLLVVEGLSAVEAQLSEGAADA